MNRNKKKRLEARIRAGGISVRKSNKNPKFDFARSSDYISPYMKLQAEKKAKKAQYLAKKQAKKTSTISQMLQGS